MLDSISQYFDIKFMLLLSGTASFFLRKTKLKTKLSKHKKQIFVIILGLLYASLFLLYQYKVYGVLKMIQYSVVLGTSLFFTIALYDLIYSFIIKKLRGR